MQLGIDFGSTYSTISKYDPDTGEVMALNLAQGADVSIPSVVFIDRFGISHFGNDARNKPLRRGTQYFEAFKMLLNEANQEMLRQRGYRDDQQVRQVTRDFLKFVLQSVLNREHRDRVEDLVVCVPDVWNRQLGTLDGRLILRQVLLNEVEVPVDHVRVVTEPEAASAFIAFNYEQQTHNNFNGHLLLIDFGGGTLDLTLTQVSATQNGVMRIQTCARGGAGENHPDEEGHGHIGSAGIAYMQAVVKLALEEAGIQHAGYTDNHFIAAVRDLEGQLKSGPNSQMIENRFGEYATYEEIEEILDEDPDPCLPLSYGDEDCWVTYQQLYRVYRDVVEDVVDREIGEINPQVQERIGIDPRSPMAGDNNDFKIAMVGGFSNFCLVKRQVEGIYQLDPNQGIDNRVTNISAAQQERAISMGAALLAAGRVDLQRTAPYSIGICTEDTQHNLRLSYGIKYGQIIRPGEPYFICHDESQPDAPGNRRIYRGQLGAVTSFVVEFSENRRTGEQIDLREGMLQRLRDLPDNGFWNLGFSMDDSEVITFHIVPRAGNMGGNIQPPEPIILDSYARAFDLTTKRRVAVR